MTSLALIKNKLFTEIKEVPAVLTNTYYPFLDGLRGIAIMSVILCHVFRYSKLLVFIDGSIGVHLFFILSGFLITTLLLKEKVKYGNVSLKNFYARRALRIFPVAYLFIAVVIVLNIVFKLQITPVSFATAVLYLKNFPLSTDWYTAHFWTLSIEEQFYLFAPVLLVRNTNLYIKLLLALFILVPVMDYLGFNNVGIFYTNRLVHVLTFIFLAIFDNGAMYILSGSLLSILIFKGIINFNKPPHNYYLSFVLFAGAAIIHFPMMPYISAITFTVLVLAAIALSLDQKNLLTIILSNRVLVKVGVLSYSIYIWQQLFTVNQPWFGHFKYADSEILNLLALALVAWLSYTYYESSILKLKKRFSWNLN
ncbi:MAG: acyltransferase [Mucilaginibacter sp.]|nr:acyltransferase [Mucilaginibacter sp.]